MEHVPAPAVMQYQPPPPPGYQPPAPAPPVAEYSTLIYSLLPGGKLAFHEFMLIIRSLHGYKVDQIVGDETTQTATVGLYYFANVNNARKKLGGKLADVISVERISDQIRREELPDLQRLRALYQFGGPIEEDEQPTRKPPKKRRY